MELTDSQEAILDEIANDMLQILKQSQKKNVQQDFTEIHKKRKQQVIKTKADNIFDETYYVDIDNFIEKTYDEYESGYPKVASQQDRKKQIVKFRKNQIETDISNKKKATIVVHCPQNEKINSKAYKK